MSCNFDLSWIISVQEAYSTDLCYPKASYCTDQNAYCQFDGTNTGKYHVHDVSSLSVHLHILVLQFTSCYTEQLQFTSCYTQSSSSSHHVIHRAAPVHIMLYTELQFTSCYIQRAAPVHIMLCTEQLQFTSYYPHHSFTALVPIVLDSDICLRTT